MSTRVRRTCDDTGGTIVRVSTVFARAALLRRRPVAHGVRGVHARMRGDMLATGAQPCAGNVIAGFGPPGIAQGRQEDAGRTRS